MSEDSANSPKPEMDDERAKALRAYQKKLLDHREVEGRLKASK